VDYPITGYARRVMLPTRALSRSITTVCEEYGNHRILIGSAWPLGLLGPELARRKLPYAVILHGAELLFPAAVPVLGRRVARALSEADLLLAVSRFTRERALTLFERCGLAPPPIELLRARVDLDRFRPDVAAPERVKAELGLDRNSRMLLCLGRLVRRKGIDRLIRALPRIATRHSNVMLVVAGTGPEQRRLQRIAAKAGAPVVFTGRVAPERAPSLFAAADVFVLPVTDRLFGLDVEGLGVVLLEAAASETVCVTGRSGGTPEAVLDGRTGFVVDAADEAALAEGVCRALDDPDLAARFGRAGRMYVEEEFSSARLPQALLDWLQLQQPPSAR
jgi:phosphatidylinositol alpha-1,6-mannosyltransferase